MLMRDTIGDVVVSVIDVVIAGRSRQQCRYTRNGRGRIHAKTNLSGWEGTELSGFRIQVSFVFPPQRPGATSFRGPFVILPKADIQATTTTTATTAADERSTGTCQIRNGRIKQCCITHGYRIRRPP